MRNYGRGLTWYRREDVSRRSGLSVSESRLIISDGKCSGFGESFIRRRERSPIKAGGFDSSPCGRSGLRSRPGERAADRHRRFHRKHRVRRRKVTADFRASAQAPISAQPKKHSRPAVLPLVIILLHKPFRQTALRPPPSGEHRRTSGRFCRQTPRSCQSASAPFLRPTALPQG